MNVFTFKQFEARFFNQSYSKDVFTAFEKRIKELQENGQIRTAQTYQDALHSFKVFTQKKRLLFEDITPTYLKKYERYMLQDNKSLIIASIYLRNLRAIYNLAIQQYLVCQELYLFGKGEYSIPTGKNIKKALTAEDLQKIFMNPFLIQNAITVACGFSLISVMGQILQILLN